MSIPFRLDGWPGFALALALSALPGSAEATTAKNTVPPAAHPGFAAATFARADAAALLATGAFAEVPARCSAAFAVPGSDELGCRLLSASALIELHRYEEAAATLEPARGRLGALEPWGALLLGEALAGAGKADRALPLLAEAAAADPEGPLGRRAEVPQALALAHTGQLEAAREKLGALLSARRGPAAELRLTLASATEAAGDLPAAAQLYHRVWRDHPGTGEAARAWERLAGLKKKEVAVPEVTADDRIDRAERLVAVGKADEALSELAAVADPDRAAEVALLRARAFWGGNRREEVEAALAPCLKKKGVPLRVRLGALELASRVAMRFGRVDDALALLRQVASEGKGHTASEAEFLAAFFLYDAGRFAEAEAAFAAFAEAHPKLSRTPEARWYRAWSLYKQGKHAESADALDELLKKHPRTTLELQVRYWKARALEQSGKKKEAHALYRSVATDEPGSWYALLARDRLGKSASRLPKPRTIARFAAPIELPQLEPPIAGRMERAVALYAAGLADEAGAELDAALSGKRDAALTAAAAQLALGAGDHHRAFQLGVFRLGGLAGAADLAYPRAFRNEVESAAKRFGVDPHFVWSIMRQESGFRPRIRSAAAAVGLMQLIPPTAEKIAAILEMDPGSAARLADPRVNVTMGSWYLGALLERFGGSYALAAASYNAGPDAVVRWLGEPARRALPLDEFVESIPYRETRHYVKQVVANLETYRLVHGGEPVVLREKLPEVKPGVEF